MIAAVHTIVLILIQLSRLHRRVVAFRAAILGRFDSILGRLKLLIVAEVRHADLLRPFGSFIKVLVTKAA